MNIGTIQKGTNAGWRRVTQTQEAWKCGCGRDNARFNKNCPACYTPRP